MKFFKKQLTPALLLLLLTPLLHAQVFNVERASVSLEGKVYYLSARINPEFNAEIQNALRQGVELVFSLDIEVLEQRSYMWNRTIATLSQRTKVKYHALTKQYKITNINSGERDVVSSLRALSEALGYVKELPVLDRELIKPDNNIIMRIRMRLERESLPVPLRLKSYISRKWDISGEWYQWRMDL